MKKKIVCLLLATMTTGILMTGCQRKENTTKQQKNKTESVEKTKEEKKDAKTENKEALEEKVETENVSEETGDTQENTTELSGDWRTLGFTMDGEQINFPISYAELKSMGYSIDAEYENEELEGMHYTTGVNATNAEGKTIIVRFKNYTNETKTIAESDIFGFRIEQLVYTDNNPTFTLCNGISFGDDVNKIKSLMGEPTYENDNDDGSRITLEYEVNANDAYDQNKVEFTLHDGKLDCVVLTNGDL